MVRACLHVYVHTYMNVYTCVYVGPNYCAWVRTTPVVLSRVIGRWPVGMSSSHFVWFVNPHTCIYNTRLQIYKNFHIHACYACLHTYIYMCIHMKYIYTYVYTYIYVNIYIKIYTYIFSYIYIYIYTYIWIRICMYIYINIYIYKWPVALSNVIGRPVCISYI